MNKQKRFWMRTVILVILAGAVLYVIYNAVNQDKVATIKMNEEAPDFTLTDLNGQTHTLKDYRGTGVFLNFWGTWCEPCEYEMPFMQNQYDQFKDKGVQILAVNVGESDFAVKKFAERLKLDYPILIDKDNGVQQQYKVNPLPVTFLIDENGIVVDSTTGSLTEDKIKEMMERIQPKNRGNKQ